jgi:hypothetical protein
MLTTVRLLAGILLIGMTGSAQAGEFRLLFRTTPHARVSVIVGTANYPVDQPATLTYSTADIQQVVFSRPGFEPLLVNITSEEAAAAFNAPEKVFPIIGQPALALVPTNFLIGWRAWAEDHPFEAIFLVLGLGLLVPGAAFRGRLLWKRQQELERKLFPYESVRDANDSMMMQTVEGYLLVQPLGKGGMATVYKGLPADTLDEKRAVAVKILAAELFADVEFGRRFQREVKAYQRLEHPNIVRLQSWRQGDASGRDFPYIILEFVNGQTLGKEIPANGMLWKQAAPLLEQLFGAVQFAHDRGVVHRDLKPDNIMLEGSKLKVMDFGLARDGEASQLTASGTILGTPSYMAPEQLARGSFDKEVDQYALGVVTYRMLTGRLPHEADDLMQLFGKVLAGKPVPPGHYRPDLSPALELVILRMLSLDPAARFSSVRLALKALESASQS